MAKTSQVVRVRIPPRFYGAMWGRIVENDDPSHLDGRRAVAEALRAAEPASAGCKTLVLKRPAAQWFREWLIQEAGPWGTWAVQDTDVSNGLIRTGKLVLEELEEGLL